MFKQLNNLTRTWAAYGLDVGKNALETSATTLKTGADALANLASKLRPTQSEPTPPPATEAKEPVATAS